MRIFACTSLLCFVTASGAALGAAPLDATPTTLDSDEQAMVRWIGTQQQAMVDDLRHVVDINSGTANVEGVDRVRAFFERALADLGFSTRTVPGGRVRELSCRGGEIRFADHLVAERHRGAGQKLLLNGHLDTVFPADSAFQRMTIDGDVLRGPGVMDMKGGLVAMLYALRALRQQHLLDGLYLTVLLNSDEEVGSLGARPLIEEEARKHDIGLVFEGSLGNNLIRSRKGLGQVRLKVNGRAAHAGNAHEDGISAIRELAYQIVDIENLTDYERQITVNVGVAGGGEARNTVPPCADAYVDLRFPDNEAGQQLVERIERIAAQPRTWNAALERSPTTEIWSTLHRPAKPVDPRSDAILASAMGISAALGERLGTQYSGGGTDGSLMQAVGLPNADSLGPDGAGNHSPRESTRISSLVTRTRLAAILIARLGRVPVAEP